MGVGGSGPFPPKELDEARIRLTADRLCGREEGGGIYISIYCSLHLFTRPLILRDELGRLLG